jgi:hypothetical protein
MKFDARPFSSFKGQFAASADGRVAADLGFDDYRIHVWNPDGSLDRIIERPEYAPVKRSDREKERFQELYDGITSWNPNSTFEISETHRAIVSLHFRPDGSLWVLSGRGVWAAGPDVFAAFDVYDRNGGFVKRVAFDGPGDPTDDGIFFGDGRIYRVTDQFGAVLANFGGGGDAVGDGEAEPLQIVAYDIDLPELGGNR